MRTLERAVLAALRETGVARGRTLLAAVSGGPDSTALLCALAAVCPAAGVTLRACTVDHGIRPPEETAADVDFVRGLCERLGVPLAAVRIAPGECAARARSTRRSLEEVARELRHGLLRDEAKSAGAHDIALGHTRDDLLETLLMRVLQGSDLEGLRGIAMRRGPFVRPLLGSTRAEVMSYLAMIGQDWRNDPSNAEERFLRNGIRRTLVPVLDRGFHGWRAGMLKLSRKLALAHEVVLAEARLLSWAEDAGCFTTTREAFMEALPAVRAQSLMLLYDRFRRPTSPRRLPWRFLAPALEKEVPRGLALHGHGALLESRGDLLRWGPDIASKGKKGYFIEVSEAGVFAAGETGMRVCLARTAGEARRTGTVAVEPGGLSILEGNVMPPLVLRSRRKGDGILLPGGVTSVKELLDRWGVGGPERDHVPLLADRKGVLAVLGSALGYESQAREGALAGDRGDGSLITVRVETGAKDDKWGDREEGREQQQR